jgi:hypothetical protein
MRLGPGSRIGPLPIQISCVRGLADWAVSVVRMSPIDALPESCQPRFGGQIEFCAQGVELHLNAPEAWSDVGRYLLPEESGAYGCADQ